MPTSVPCLTHTAGVQAVLSLLPNLESVWLVSAVGAVMSVGASPPCTQPPQRAVHVPAGLAGYAVKRLQPAAAGSLAALNCFKSTQSAYTSWERDIFL